MLSETSVRVKTDQLPVGSRLGHPIYDCEERLLLAAGSLITDDIKQLLRDRGFDYVQLHPQDAAALDGQSTTKPSQPPIPPPKHASTPSRPASTGAPVAVHNGRAMPTVSTLRAKLKTSQAAIPQQMENMGPALAQQLKTRGCEPYDVRKQERLQEEFSSTTDVLNQLVEQAYAGRLQNERPLSDTTSQFVGHLLDDADQAIDVSAERAPNPNITERGMRLSLLAMATAIEMGWDATHVREVGLCGLVHDWGMFQLAEKLHDPARTLSSSDQAELAQHPLFTAELLEPLPFVSPAVRTAATQVHENLDGSGYPLGLQHTEIHPLAHVLHVVDAYITLTAEMHGRPAYLPYDVMVYLLNQVKAGRMQEQATRAFLNVISLFPIGSHVRLSDGSEARVIRRNAQHYTSPIVQRVGASGSLRIDPAHASIIDLATSNLRVMAPLESPDREAVRLDETLMGQILWEG